MRVMERNARSGARSALQRLLPRVLLGATVTLAGCASERAPTHTVRDSAGVSLVENATPDSAHVLTFEEELRFGDAEGEPVYQFGSIADVAVDGTGRFIVLDQLAGEARVFAEDGSFVRTLGRRGAGPGEISRWVSAVLTDADGRVYLPDPVQRRITVFDSSGAALPALAIPSQPAGQSWSLEEDGSFLFRGMSVRRGADGAFAFWDGLLRASPGDSAAMAIDTLLVFDFPPTPIGAPPDVRVPLIVNTPFWAPLPDGRIAWASLDRSQVQVHDGDGGLAAIIRTADWRRRSISDADVTLLRDRLRERLESMGGDATAADGPNVDAPDSLPAITSLLSDDEGRLWVQQMGSAAEVDPSAVNSAAARTAWLGGQVWDVLSADGTIVARAMLPQGMRPVRIANGRVYGVVADSVGVQRVVRLRITRPGDPT